MPIIKSSTDLRNNYNDISNFCHSTREPIFITKNGQGDLAVMSIDAYEIMEGRLELYALLDESRKAVQEGRTHPLKKAIDDIRKGVTSENL